MALAKRIIPCLDVDNGRVVKGVKFVDIRDAGDPVEVARRYDEEGADEALAKRRDKSLESVGIHVMRIKASDILEDMEETDPEMAEEIRKKMFTFENLIALDGRSLQMILREINNDSLTLALKTASEQMREKIYSNLSNRAADMIRDDLEAMGPVRLSEVELVQQSIVKIALKLEEEGKLALGSGGGDELV